MQSHTNVVQRTNGAVVDGATVKVYLSGTSTLATIYSDNGVTPIVQATTPLTSSNQGEYTFYAADGRYDVVVSYGNVTDDPYEVLLRDTPVNIRTYGALGDNSNIDTTAFQNAVAIGSSTIEIPVGNYKVDGTTVITSDGISIIGQGEGVTITMYDLDAPIFAIGDPNTAGNEPKNILFENINFVQNETQIDINGAGLYGLDLYKTAAAILHGRGDRLTIKNCTFTNFPIGIAYYGNADSEGAATADGFHVDNCFFDQCNFGIWIDGANDVTISNLRGRNTQFIQISGGSTLPPHLIYNTSINQQQTNWVITNVIDDDNPEASTIKLKYVENLTISNVVNKGCSELIDLIRCNNFTISNIVASATLNNTANTFSAGSVRLVGCTNGSINGIDIKVTDAQHVIFLDKLPASEYSGGVDIFSSDITINNLVVDYQPSPNTPNSIIRMEETNRIAIINPIIKRQTGHNVYLFYCDYTDTAGTDNLVINPIVFSDSGDTYKHQIFFAETGITNSKLVANEALLNQSSTGDAIANSNVDVYWATRETSLSFDIVLGTADDQHIIIPYICNVTAIYSVIDVALSTADETLTFKNNAGTAMTNGVITITQSGSADGDIDSCSPTANNSFTAGQKMTCSIGGENGNAVNCQITVKMSLT